MTLNFNLKGAERKPLLKAISAILETEAVYLKTPTCAYQIGAYHLDRNGVLTGADNFDLATALRNKGFTAESYEYDAAEPETETEPGTEREELGLGRERRENAQEENGMSADDVPDRFTVEMPLEGFTPEKLENLTRIVEAKAELLKAALGADALPIQVLSDRIAFPWFNADGIFSGNGEDAEPYTTLISLLCETAKEKKRVTAKPKELPENPKYAMRCWLLSLGFIGAEYAKCRKVLLSKLDGNSSWKNGKPETNVG